MYQCILTEDQAKQNSVCPIERLQYYLHISGYRISYARWTPGNFSSLHQRMVTCPRMRQLFSLPQCSLFNTPSLCLQHALPFSPCKTCYQQTFSAWKKMVHFVDFLLSFFYLIFFWSWITVLSSNSIIYLSFFSFLPVEVSKQSEFQRNEKPWL